MSKVRYKFTRSNNIAFVISSNRPSTDALNALHKWYGKPGRSYEVIEDEVEHLVADLEVAKDDESAGPELGDACESAGVERTYICAN